MKTFAGALQRSAATVARSAIWLALSTGVDATVCAASDVPTVTSPSLTPTPAALLRLRSRHATVQTSGAALVSTPVRYNGDERMLFKLATLGYADADSFVIPDARVGAAVLAIHFPARGSDARSEAISLFRELVDEFSAAQAEFVVFRAGLGKTQDTATRYDWLFWHTPQDEWVLVDQSPYDYFEAKLAQERAQPRPDPSLVCTYLLQLAHINFTNDRRAKGAALMQAALHEIDSATPDRQVAVNTQLSVLRALVSEAVNNKDEALLTQWIKRYVLLAGAAHVSVPNQPVEMIEPAYEHGGNRGGSVRLEFDVREDGRTAKAVVLSSTASNAFTRAAQRAVLTWRFLPEVREGVPVPSRREWQFNVPVAQDNTPNYSSAALRSPF